MTIAQAEKALGHELEGEAIDDENVCVEKQTPVEPGIIFMFENRRLSRISIRSPSRVLTARYIGISMDADDVRRAYGKGLKAEPHHYEDLPSEYLTFWTVPGKRGVRFETDSKRRVQAIHAGTSAIQYVEGCA